MLIRAYALYWNPDIVNWGKKGPGNAGKLLGKVKIKGKSCTIDFWNAQGVYILHEDFRTVYVGKAWGTAIGTRLKSHLTDRFAGRWDMFSWFSVSKANKVKKNVSKPGKRHVAPSSAVSTLEALGILITDAPLNRKRESIPGALRAEQEKSPYPHTIRHYLETILSELTQNKSKRVKS